MMIDGWNVSVRSLFLDSKSTDALEFAPQRGGVPFGTGAGGWCWVRPANYGTGFTGFRGPLGGVALISPLKTVPAAGTTESTGVAGAFGRLCRFVAVALLKNGRRSAEKRAVADDRLGFPVYEVIDVLPGLSRGLLRVSDTRTRPLSTGAPNFGWRK